MNTNDMEEILSILLDGEVNLCQLVREISILNPRLVIEANKNLKIKDLMVEPWVKEAMPFIRSGDKISAVKIHRKHTNALLIDSVNVVKAIMKKLGVEEWKGHPSEQ